MRIVVAVVVVAASAQAADFGAVSSNSLAELTAYTPRRRALPYVEPEYGLGVETSGGAGVIPLYGVPSGVAVAELSLNARYRGALGSLEFWVRMAWLPKLSRFSDDLGGSATFVWRTPNLVTGSFRWNLGIGLGAEFIRLCEPEFCSPFPGVRLELKPTLEYVANHTLRPYVAVNASGFVVLGSGVVLWTGALAVGVHFNFAPIPPPTAGVASASRGQ